MNMVLILLVGYLYLIPISALGCFAPKAEQITAPDLLVKKTEEIYLGEAVGSKAKGFVDFKVVETLKGKSVKKKTIEAQLRASNDTDFDKHEAADFWQPSGGRMQIEPSCEISPYFEKGKRYLVFVGKPYHVKSFELIADKNDRWLKRVRDLLLAK